MKTLYRKEDDDDEERSVKKKKKKKRKVSFPTEIVEDIVSRLPVKSILRSRSVSKQWLSLISNPSFNKLQFNRATESHRTALFFSASDFSTHKHHYFTAANDGGPLTLLMTIDDEVAVVDISGPSHLNGFMRFTIRTGNSTSNSTHSHALVVNPATRKVFQLPDMNSPSTEYTICGYLYGFDQSRNEHKILLVKNVFKTNKYEFMIFSMSSFSWRKIDAEPPVGFDWRRLGGGLDGGVSVNSAVHLMIYEELTINDLSCRILAFDFVTEKFAILTLPQGVSPPPDDVDTTHLTKINGYLAVVAHNRKRSQIHIWLLQDYDNRVWVKETIKHPESWNMIVRGFPISIDGNMDDEIVFNTRKVTENRVTVPVYNRKTKQFKTLVFNLDDQFASVTFHHVKYYVETIIPLRDNCSIKSHRQSH